MLVRVIRTPSRVVVEGLDADPHLGGMDDAVPRLVEIDVVGHEAGNALGEHCYTLTRDQHRDQVDENRSPRTRPRKGDLGADGHPGYVPFPDHRH